MLTDSTMPFPPWWALLSQAMNPNKPSSYKLLWASYLVNETGDTDPMFTHSPSQISINKASLYSGDTEYVLSDSNSLLLNKD